MSDKPECPKCGGSEMVIGVGAQRHCNACGVDFAFDRNPIATHAYARKLERSAQSGYSPHVHANAAMANLEKESNAAEEALRAATRRVLACKTGDPELPALRRIERDCREKREALLQRRSEY